MTAVIACKNTNNPQRNFSNNPNLALTLQTCDPYSKVVCNSNCDVCIGFDC